MKKILGIFMVLLLSACGSNQTIPDTTNYTGKIQSIVASITDDCDALLSVHVAPNASCMTMNSCNVTVHLKYKGESRANCQMRYELNTFCRSSGKTNVRSYLASRDRGSARENVQYRDVSCY